MGKLVTFQLEAELVEPLVETLKSRAQAWQETTRILRSHRPKDNEPPNPETVEAARMARLYTTLIEKITHQLDAF
jgi:hypothetical protein